MLRFETPIWVRHKKDRYLIRPLFQEEPLVSDKRYEEALRKFVKALRKTFSDEKLSEEKRQELLWFQFLPAYHTDTYELEFPYGRRFFSGNLTVVRFQIKGYTYVCLPAVNNYFFISRHENPNRSQLVNELIEHMQRWPRTQKSQEKGEFILDHFAAEKREFCINVEVSLYVRQEQLQLEVDDGDLFKQFFRQASEFDGSFEIRRVGQDLNDQYPHELHQAFFMDDMVSQLHSLLYGKDRVPLAIIGPRKVGKSTLLHEAIRHYLQVNQERDFPLLDNIWHIDPSRVIAGMSVVGMWQRRMEAIIGFAMQPHPTYTKRKDKLYFSNLIALFRIGKSAQNNMTLSDVLKPYLQNRQIQLVLEATPEEWDVASEIDRSFTDLFKVMRVAEASDADSLKIIAQKRAQLEKDDNFQIDNIALKKLIELQKRFARQEVLVGGTCESLYQLARKYSSGTVNSETVVREFGVQTHLHPRIADTSIALGREAFRAHLSQQIIGQNDAIDCMTDLISSLKAQLNDPDRPYGSFLFIGPTGVGKTHAAKTLADYLFTHEDRLVRFDMNEFIDGNAVNRLVGDFQQPEGQLTAKIRYNPYCVLLFDEIEKAHPDVHNLLLQVLGEGRLTDALGRTVSFCNTVIMMTSNLGADRVRQEINLLGREDLAESTYRKAVMDFFRPEFINRIDQVVIFHRLEAKHIAEIAWQQIHHLLRRHGFVRRHTILNITREALERIAARGFDPEYGGRALKRQIEKDMTLLLAEQLVETPPQNPIIFNILVQDQKLLPQLVSLEHIAPTGWQLPDFSEEQIGQEAFEKMLERIAWVKMSLQKLEEAEEDEEGGILVFEEGDAEMENMLSLKEQIFELEEQLKTIVWDFQTRKQINLTGSNFRTKSISRNLDESSKGFLRELYVQMAVKDYLQDLIGAADRIVEEGNSIYFELHHSICWLEYFASKYIHKGVERMLIHLKPLVSKNRLMPPEEVFCYFIASLYQDIHPAEIISLPGKDDLFLALEGPGLLDLFQQEAGVHLLFLGQQSLFPLACSVHRIPALLSATDFAHQLAASPSETGDAGADRTRYTIRLYTFEDQNWKYLWHSHRKKKQLLRSHLKGSITDLRTAMLNPANLRKREVQLLFWESLDAHISPR